MAREPTDPTLLARARKLRAHATREERWLWAQIRSRGLDGFRFRRQVPMAPYILDFYCHQRRLAVEIDGSGHAEVDTREGDEARTATLEARGIRILRFWNDEVIKNVAGVIERIAFALSLPLPPPGGRGKTATQRGHMA